MADGASKMNQPTELLLLRHAVSSVTQFEQSFAETIWNVSKKAAHRRLSRLVKRGLLAKRNILASYPPPIAEPLCHWRPGEPFPHFGQVSYLARKRTKDRPVEIIPIYHATALGRGLIGREATTRPKALQASHDLGLTATFMHHLQRWPKLTEKCWLNETEYGHLRGRCVKVEDALLQRNGRVLLLIDFCGSSYTPQRISDLVRHAHYYDTPIKIF